MQTCYNCGEQVDDNVLICPSCGALVKRYGSPVRQSEPEPVSEPVSPGERAAVFQNATGKLCLRTAVKVLLVIGVVLCLYTALSFACVLTVYNNQELYFGLWQQMPQLSAMTETLQLLMEAVRDFYVLYLLYPVVLAAQAAAMIWFLCSKRRLAFSVTAATAAAVFLVGILLGGIGSAILYSLPVLLSWILLKRDWNRLPN